MVSMIVNLAHAESAYTCLTFSQDGSKLYTGGEEGYVRIWRSDLGSEQEPDVAVEAEDAITSVAAAKECWLSGSRDACVRTYAAHGSTMEGFITRAIAVPIRCIAIDPKGERAAITSDELEVKIINLNDITDIKKLNGHRKGVRRATWHPSGNILTTCGSDGDILVWDVSPQEDPKVLEIIKGVIPATDSDLPEYNHDCSAIWHPSGKYFVVASCSHEIITISKETWEKGFTFSDNAVTGVVTALGFSPNGMYLTSATPNGIFIWSTSTHRVLFKHVPISPFALVSHLAFSPTRNLIAWTDADGTLTRWPDPIPDTSPSPVKVHAISSDVGISAKKRSEVLALFEDENATNTKDGDVGMNDIAGEEENYGLDDEDWIIDDIGLLDKPEKENSRLDGGYPREMVSVTKAQPPFQSASTPMTSKKRYLAFNMIGVIEVTDQDTHYIVNIDFHDRSTRAASFFQDPNKCDLASLGERGALYACSSENGHPAQIIYKPYSSWASSGDWHFSLPEGETVIALAAGGCPPSGSLRHKTDGHVDGNGNVIVATSRGYLRFFTGGGLQSYIWALGADVVTMVAGREWVFVVHRDGGTSLDGCQNLAYSLVALDTFTIVQTGRLPLPKNTILKWIGISEEGAPAMYDSNGLLSILDRFRRPSQARWIPILDTTTMARREGKDESYWPVGVSSAFFMCLILKGRETHPGFPRPLIQELEVRMPLLSLDMPQGQIEERFLREELHIGFLRDTLGSDLTSPEISQRELKLDKQLIQLIQFACKSEKLQRALDAASLFHHTASFDMAIKVAEFYHLAGLQEKILALKSERAEMNRLEEEKDQRKKWGKHSAPIPTPHNHAREPSHQSRFEEFAPPLSSIRKSLAPAVPIKANKRATHDDTDSWGPRGATTTAVAMKIDAPENSLWDDPSGTEDSVKVMDGKRKRDELDASEVQISVEGSVNKKHAVSSAGPSATDGQYEMKACSNPFARKTRDTKGNPFARPGPAKANLAKSNSFFDKIDEANEIATHSLTKTNSKGKEKEKKDTIRQTTLFGLPPGSVAEKKGRGKSSKTSSTSKALSEVSAPLSQPAESAMSLDISETQVTDITMVDTTSAEESRPEPEQLPTESEDLSQPPEDSLEIEWPPSPPRVPTANATSEVVIS